MSKRSPFVSAEALTALGAGQRQLESYSNRALKLGSLEIARALPLRDRRMVGPWCFLDRFGPLTFDAGKPMDVAPHPHIGLQTVTWLHAGEVMHDDSLGFESVLRPGGVNVMTSGSGIAHAEQTPPDNSRMLDGVQLWTALPDEHRHVAASFAHVAQVPVVEWSSGVAQVFAGTLDAATPPLPYFSDLLGADLRVHPHSDLTVPLRSEFEHAILVMNGDCMLDGQPLHPGLLYYLGTTRTEASFASREGGRVLLIGGPPFPETILMWWNFVARAPEEIVQAREDWEERRRFGEVRAYNGPRLDAPALSRLARPNPAS